MKTILKYGVIALGLYVLNTASDTGLTEALFDFLPKGDSQPTPPEFWMNYRMYLIGIVVFLFVLFYLPVFKRYLETIKIDHEQSISSTKPDIPYEQAAYYIGSSLSNWIIQMCERGAIKLLYDYGSTRLSNKALYPWSIQKTSNIDNLSEIDKSLLDMAFPDKNTILLKADVGGDPNPGIATAANHYRKAQKEQDLPIDRSSKNNMLPAYFLLAAVFLDTAFVSFVNSTFFVLFISIAISIFFAAAVRISIYHFNGIREGNLIAVFSTLIFISIAGVAISGMSDIIDPNSFLYYYLYPIIAVSMVVFIKTEPAAPTDINLLKQVIAYRNYLKQQKTVTKDDLKWRLALDADTNIFKHNWEYSGLLPDWIESTEEDNKRTIVALHNTFPSSLRDAIYGESKISGINQPSVIKRGL